LPLTEDAPTCPINPYGATKLAAEQLITWTAAAHGLRTVALRYFNAAGADESLKIGLEKPVYTHLVPVATRAALGLGEAVDIYGGDWLTPDGTCIRDYIHISDLSKAHLLAADYLLAEKQSLLLNLGTAQGSSVKEVLEAVDVLAPVPYCIAPRRVGDSAVLVADATRAAHTLGWSPKRTLADIVSSDFTYRQAAARRSDISWS
jgi:UDP-glucose 4-epimerase